MNAFEQIAAQLFGQYQIDFATVRQGNGWTNKTWIADGFVLRLSVEQGREKIRREAELSKVLPMAAGYPEIVAVGVTDGCEWSLARKIPGSNGGEIWEALDGQQQKNGVGRLFEISSAIHAVEIEKVRELVSEKAWYSSFEADESLAAAGSLVKRNVISAAQGKTLVDALSKFFAWFPNAEKVLNHGDITLENTIWQPDGKISLLDFEHAVLAPVQLDIHSLIRIGFGPKGFNGTESQPIQSEVLHLAKSWIRSQKDFDLLLGFAILLSQRRMDIWLEHSQPGSSFERWEPFLCLQSLTDGKGGYLSPLLEWV